MVQNDLLGDLPFAKPPVGNLRFVPAAERRHWISRILNGTESAAT